MGVLKMINSTVLTSIIGNQKLTELISENDIKIRISEIAADISKNYVDQIPIVIGVLNGSFLFLADIVRKLDIQYEVDFIKISSYGNSVFIALSFNLYIPEGKYPVTFSILDMKSGFPSIYSSNELSFNSGSKFENNFGTPLFCINKTFVRPSTMSSSFPLNF